MRRLALVMVGLVLAPEVPLARADDPPPVPDDPDPGAGEGLLTALLALFDPWAAPGRRAAAIDDPALRDPRAIPALVFVLDDPDADVRARAATVLGRFRGDPRVEAALIERLRQRTERIEVRTAAAASLARQGGPAAGRALHDLYVDEGAPLALRESARAALEAGFPDLLADRGTVEVVDRSGRALLTVGAAVLGSYALAAVGALGQNDTGVTIGIFGGLVTGAGTGYFLTRQGEITRGQAGWMLTGGGWGAGLGMLAAAAAVDDPSDRLVLSLGLLGEAVGLGATIWTRRSIGFGPGDVALVNAGGLLGLDLALGVSYLADDPDDRAVAAQIAGGAAAGLFGAGLLTRHTRFSLGDRALVAAGGYEGLWFGSLIPPAVNSGDDRRQAAGALLGIGLGFAAAGTLSQFVDVDSDTVALGWLIGSYGKLIGVSIPLLGEREDDKLARGTIAGSALSLGAAFALAPRLEFEQGDAALVGLGTGLGLWHGLAFGVATDRFSEEQALGLTLLGAAGGGLATMGASQWLELSNTEVLAIGGGGFWGTWFTVWTGALVSDDPDYDLRPAVIAGDIGLGAGALLIQKVDARRVGIANLGGLSGAALASLGTALVTTDDDKVIAANLIGSGVGLGAGALLAATIDLAPASPTAAGAGSVAGMPSPTLGFAPLAPLFASPSADDRMVGLSVIVSM